ncbi:MAG: hypothetical protein ABEJ65_10570 [bacterium]
MDVDELTSKLEDIPGFEADPDLTPLLLDDPREMDEDTRSDVQTYKSKILKARRDADMSGGKPPWWTYEVAPETLPQLAGEETREAGGGAEEASSEEPEKTEETTEESAEETGEEPSEDQAEEVEAESEPEEEPEPAAPQIDPEEVQTAVQRFLDDELSEDELTEEIGEAAATAAISVRDDYEQWLDSQVEKRFVESRDELEPTEEELLAADLIDGEVENESANNCFRVGANNRKAALFYSEDSSRLVLHNFSLPQDLDNQWLLWLQDLLVKHAFDYAEENELSVFGERPDIYKDFLKRYPEYEERLENDLESAA